MQLYCTPRLGSSAFRTPSTILEPGVVPSGSSQAIASKRHFLTILTFKRQTCQSVKPYRSASTCVQLEAMARSSLPTTWLMPSEFTSGCHFAEHEHIWWYIDNSVCMYVSAAVSMIITHVFLPCEVLSISMSASCCSRFDCCHLWVDIKLLAWM